MMQEKKNIRKIKILLADDHAVVREGIRRVMEQEADFEVVAALLEQIIGEHSSIKGF